MKIQYIFYSTQNIATSCMAMILKSTRLKFKIVINDIISIIM